MRLRRLTILVMAGLVSVFLIWVLSPTVIIPPTKPVTPVVVYVVKLGFHSRLVLPNRRGGLIQYAYGDWNYFGLNQQDWHDGLAALLIPTPGTLGRRQFNNFGQLQQLVEQPDDAILSFAVAEVKIGQLLQILNDRYQRHIETQVINPQSQLALVQDDRNYTLLHNSNHELVMWLKVLDCQVQGFTTLAKFQVKSRED